MRKAIVFLTASLLVLSAGAAFALMVSDEGPDETAGEPTTTSVGEVEKPSTTKAADEKLDKVVSDESDDKPSDVKVSGEKEPDDDEASGEKEPEKKKKAPQIHVLSPEEGKHFTEDHVAFEGEVTRGAKVFAGKWEADVTDDGHWRIVLILAPGKNTVNFTAVKNGKEAHDQVSVYLDVEEEEKEEPKQTEFTAHQKYGSCAEEVPYDVWYGTGKPGTKIFIVSDFGSEDGKVGENGKWEIKVKFPEAPCGDEFKVVLETDDGHRKVYEFVRFCEEDHEGGDKGHDGEK